MGRVIKMDNCRTLRQDFDAWFGSFNICYRLFMSLLFLAYVKAKDLPKEIWHVCLNIDDLDR